MKKSFALLLVLLLCLPFSHCQAEEAGAVERESFTCGDYTYALLDDGTAEITKHLGEAETLEVPFELDGHSVTFIGTSVFSWCDRLTEITVGRDSYARQYCIDNDLPYTYADANDWLNG